MIYNNHRFLVVPNVPSLFNFNIITQAIYLNLCYEANKQGQGDIDINTIIGNQKISKEQWESSLMTLHDAGMIECDVIGFHHYQLKLI